VGAGGGLGPLALREWGLAADGRRNRRTGSGLVRAAAGGGSRRPGGGRWRLGRRVWLAAGRSGFGASAAGVEAVLGMVDGLPVGQGQGDEDVAIVAVMLQGAD
jgi:hypothetical protein